MKEYNKPEAVFVKFNSEMVSEVLTDSQRCKCGTWYMKPSEIPGQGFAEGCGAISLTSNEAANPMEMP